MTDDFEGWLTPGGKLISIDDVDGMLSFIAGRHEDPGHVADFLRGIAFECIDKGKLETARAYLEKVLLLIDSPSERAECLLHTGLVLEGMGNYAAAAEVYSRAFELPRESDETWYFLNNNRGYCLNREGRFAEAEGYCRAAIEIDPERHNAYKNLGLALHGLGRHVEAARNFIHATLALPTDPRALAHLEQLLSDHPEVLEKAEDVLARLPECHEAVRSAGSGPQVQ